MLKNRLFYFVVLLGLLVIAAVLAFQTVSTAKVAEARQNVPVTGLSAESSAACPFTTAEIQSLHPVWEEAIGKWVYYTDQGPVGIDGGLEALRSCQAINK